MDRGKKHVEEGTCVTAAEEKVFRKAGQRGDQKAAVCDMQSYTG